MSSIISGCQKLNLIDVRLSRNDEHVHGVDVLIMGPVEVYLLGRDQRLIRRGYYFVPTLVAYVEIGDRGPGVADSDLYRSITELPDRGAYSWQAGRGRAAYRADSPLYTGPGSFVAVRPVRGRKANIPRGMYVRGVCVGDRARGPRAGVKGRSGSCFLRVRRHDGRGDRSRGERVRRLPASRDLGSRIQSDAIRKRVACSPSCRKNGPWLYSDSRGNGISWGIAGRELRAW